LRMMVGPWIIFIMKTGMNHILKELRIGLTNTIAYFGSKLITQKIKNVVASIVGVMLAVAVSYAILAGLMWIVWRI